MLKKMKLTFPEDFDYVRVEFDKTGVWEPRTTGYVKEHLKEGQTLFI